MLTMVLMPQLLLGPTATNGQCPPWQIRALWPLISALAFAFFPTPGNALVNLGVGR